MEKDADEWIAACDAANIPSGKINTIEQVFAHPQTLARDMLVEVEHPTIGALKMPGIVPKLSRTPGQVAFAGPALGEHNRDVFGELLGLDDERIRALADEGAI